MKTYCDKFVYLDFEFNHSSNKNLNLVSCVTYIKGEEGVHWWLHNNIRDQIALTKYLEILHSKGYTFVAYAAVAECRSILSLPNWTIPIQEMKWIDLWLEHRNLLNHHKKYTYGKQLINKQVKTLKPPRRAYGDKMARGEDNYAAACYLFLGEMIDTERKDRVRDIIIEANEERIEEHKYEILEYNEDDVVNLPKMLEEILKIYNKEYVKEHQHFIEQWMLSRGEYAARTALMEQMGYGINYECTKNFSKSVPFILGDIQAEINSLFPDIAPFVYDLKTGNFRWNQKGTREWLETLPIVDDWELTKPSKRHPHGQLSLSQDAFFEHFPFRHEFPKDNLGAQFVRYLKTKQHCNGFIQSKTGAEKKTLWDAVGSDGRVRPFMNIYKSQSSRSQPSSTSFMFLKAAWMRALVTPDKGRANGGIDWSSQEFLIAGYESGDQNMVEAYFSGDVYLWFGKKCKKIPEEATKQSHKELRDRFKSTVLGIMYLMGAKSLSYKIQGDTGQSCSEEEAQEYIDFFDKIFSDYSKYRTDVHRLYKRRGYLILPDGWTLWGANPNDRSVKNCPIQGAGACIMRKSVAFAQDAGLEIPFSLHDALYMESDTEHILHNMDVLAWAMDEGFRYYYQGKRPAMLEGSIWSQDFPNEDLMVVTPEGMKLKQQQIYIDGRGKAEYEQFSQYFKPLEIDLL